MDHTRNRTTDRSRRILLFELNDRNQNRFLLPRAARA